MKTGFKAFIRTGKLAIGAILVLCQSSIVAEAADIKKVTLNITGEIKSGDMINESLPELEAGSSRFYIESYDFTNGMFQWDRRDAPQLSVVIYPEDGYDFQIRSADEIRVHGLEGTCARYEWIVSDESEEYRPSGLRLFIDLEPLSRPGASALAREEQIKEECSRIHSRKKAREALEQSVADGWYEDANGWWYLEPDRSFSVSSWKQYDGQWYYLGPDGYMMTGWFQADGLWYYAGENGALMTNRTTPDGCQVDADGVWVQ